MKSFFKRAEKNSKKPGKLVIALLLVLMSFSFLITQPIPVYAQGAPVFDSIGQAWRVGDTVWNKITNSFKYLWQKGGSQAFQQTLRTVLNRVAMDSANYVGSGFEGQKPLFVTKDWGTYLADVGDEAAGAYLENFANNLSASSGCEKKKKECVDQCVGSDSVCAAQCDGVCDSSADRAKQKQDCKNKCQSVFNDEMYASTNNLTVNTSAETVNSLTTKRTSCLANCDSSFNSSGNDLSNSLATPSFNVCQPSSIDAKLKITLGLAEQSRAQGPDCKATDIVKNWGEIDNYGNSVQALKNLYDSTQGGYNDQVFLNDIKGIFDPAGNDIGIYLTAKSDSAKLADNKKVVATNVLVGKGGWLDAQTIAGTSKSLPNQAEISSKESYRQYSDNFGKYTGDAFVDALNTFLSQTAFTAFNTLMQNIGKTSTQGNTKNIDLTNANNGPTTTGEGAIQAESNKLNRPDFSSKANYDILSQLSICQNPDKPGPTDCVIDNKFMQAIAEHKTVLEAVKDGSLNGTWQLTKDNVSDAYTLRNIAILREYRILPVGWEVAISKATSDPAHLRQITLNDLISCYDPDGDYKKFSSNFNQQDQDWCRGLVDPNWVLKAPLNSCRKLGIGGQVLNFTVNPGSKGANGQPDLLSTYSVTRAEDYCADNQTCIKEKNNGSCDAYGYCSEERRTWNFGSDSCAPINNTCQTFTGGAASKSVSYLQNTLDYANCNASNAGCRQYSLTGNYASGTVAWDASKSLYFNGSQSFTTCDQSAEGCTGLLRVKSPGGTNLVINSDFSADEVGASSTTGLLNAWPISGAGDSYKATIVDPQSDPIAGSRALKLEASGAAGSNIYAAVYSDNTNSLLPANLQIISGQAYTLSADVYLAEGDKAQVTIGSDTNNTVYSETDIKNSWQRIKVTRSPISAFNEQSFFIKGYGSGGKVTIYIKNIKFEASNLANNYSVYGASKIYEKLLPNYLEKACYSDALSASKDYSLKSDAPAICKNFARKCNKDEVGCELYKSAADNFSVAAKVSSADICPQECLNYDVYISRQTSFNLPQKENLIPANSKKCNFENVGCNEFTNLDALNQGGEQKEYYTELKQCIKPSTTDCASYYAWEGTENGYQLKSYSLKKGLAGGPATTADDSLSCNSAIYHSSVGSANYNPDCLEFYNSAGQIYYHLASKTITCSADCHSYRLTEKNIDPDISSAAQCVGTDKNWDANSGSCQVCLNGGVFDANHNACLYQAIPSEGKTCQAAANGCREYNGSNGENVRLISASDFENANSLGNWSSNCVNGLSLSPIANTNNGHSLKYNNNAASCQALGETAQTTITRAPLIKQILASDNVAAQLKVGQSVKQGLSYNISFMARAAANTNLKIYFYNKETKEKTYFNSASGIIISGGNEWQIYRANLENLAQTVSANEILAISADNDFYLDNFVLSEISERYYIIKNSSQIPASCYYDNFGVYQGADYNLGCRQYSDRANIEHDLRQFSKLCAESGVGCEQMIDTKNYSPGGPGFWNDTNNNKQCDANEPDCVSVPGDSAIYAVYDLNKQCNVSDLGCSRLGQGTKVGNTNLWTDVFRRNNPDNYNTILCRQSSVGCEKWSDNSGATSYFKDPYDNTCVYRAAKGSSSANKSWFKSAVKRCDKDKTGTINGAELNSAVCSTNADCGAGNSCVLDDNDYPCPISNLKTLGLGGAGNQVPVPSQATGLCEAKESTCTEYIDPVSAFVPNLVYNPDYQLIGGNREGWTAAGTQDIKIEAYKLYIFKVEGPAGTGDTRLNFDFDVKPLLNNNSLATSTKELVIPDSAAEPLLFYSLSNATTTVSNPNSSKTIIVRPAVVDYQLQSNIDAVVNTCNGNVNFDQGCILFNERSTNGSAGLATLVNNAYAPGTSPATCLSTTPGSCNANKLIKVSPNRVCAKWLSCITYVQEPGSTSPTCYAIGECNRLSDDNKECANFTDTPGQAARIYDAAHDKNSSGYSLMNKYYLGQMKEIGLNSDFHYDFEDLVPTLSCSRALGGSCSFTNGKSMVKELLVREKAGAPTDYPASGKTYLKVPSGYLISPQVAGVGVSLLADRDYYLTFLINTKNASVGGQVYIKYFDGSSFKDLPGANKQYHANNGWERKILKFHTDKTSILYRVELGSDMPNQEGNVYFDDLNIEPVLEVAPNQYAARECRLYPEASSLTCNNSLTRSGFEGYCLEHDLKNPAVCTLWYPVDHINSAVTGKAMNGYQGSAPLNYCTQINGNFDLVEKRTGAMNAFAGGSTDFYDLLSRIVGDNSGKNAPLGCEKGININGSCRCLDDATSFKICGSSDYNAIYGTNGYTQNDMVLVYCAPKQSDLLMGTQKTVSFNRYNSTIDCEVNFKIGWAPYNGLLYKNYTYSSAHGVSIETSLLEAIDESQNADPPVRVYDHNNPPSSEAGLKLISGSDQSKTYRLSCDNFSQVVNSNSDNMAWSNRISNKSLYPTSTPLFFLNGTIWYGAAAGNQLARYGRNRENIPFGAATLPADVDLLSSEAVKFRNQYSTKENESVLAGRPYGCDNGGGHGCSLIGSCSLNPDVYCLIDPITSSSAFNINKKTCGEGGFGVCQPLWSKSLSPSAPANSAEFKNILQTLFLKTYSSYSYDGGSYLADNSGYNSRIGLGECSSAIRDADSSPSSFCAIYPQVKNVKLKLNGQVIQPSGTNTYNISKRGVYALEFNSIIDKEQQPLKEIHINWGDSDQIITGQDAKESAATPHVFYHYYNTTGAKTITITVTDNWGFYSPPQ